MTSEPALELNPVRTSVNGYDGTIFPIHSAKAIPTVILGQMFDLMNHEITKGDTYPREETFESVEEFSEYWVSHFCAIYVEGHIDSLSDASVLLGTFYIRPNYVGRCSHVCNAGFLVNPNKRGRGIGKTLGKQYLVWAPLLGYEYSVFNLVFVTNPASIRIWDGLGFERIGLIKGVGRLRGHEQRVDAIMFGKQLLPVDSVTESGWNEKLA